MGLQLLSPRKKPFVNLLFCRDYDKPGEKAGGKHVGLAQNGTLRVQNSHPHCKDIAMITFSPYPHAHTQKQHNAHSRIPVWACPGMYTGRTCT